MMERIKLVLVLGFAFLLYEVHADGGHVNISLRVLQYDNPEGTSYHGQSFTGDRKCCDVSGNKTCVQNQSDKCDTYFVFCIGSLTNTGCSGLPLDTATQVLNDTVSYSLQPARHDILVAGLMNNWQSYGLNLVANILDQDSNTYDLIDNFTRSLADINPSQERLGAKPHVLHFHHLTSLDVELKVWCQDHYSGANCDIPCDMYSVCENPHTRVPLPSCGNPEVISLRLPTADLHPLSVLRQNIVHFLIDNICPVWTTVIDVTLLHVRSSGLVEFRASCGNGSKAHSVAVLDITFITNVFIKTITKQDPKSFFPAYQPIPAPAVETGTFNGFMYIMLRFNTFMNTNQTNECRRETCMTKITVCMENKCNSLITFQAKQSRASTNITTCDGYMLDPTIATGVTQSKLSKTTFLVPLSTTVLSIKIQVEVDGTQVWTTSKTTNFTAGKTYDKAIPISITLQDSSKSISLGALIWCSTTRGGDQCQAVCPGRKAPTNKECSGNGTYVCKQGFQGASCSPIDECKTNPCHHAGTCTNTAGSFRCQCSSAWTGTDCRVDVDECSLGVCSNCTNTPGSFTCNCPPGFTGKQCEDIDECSSNSNTCLNQGTCLNTYGDYECLCKPGYTGDTCGEDVNECSMGHNLTSPCGHGDCINNPGSYTCHCDPGFIGKYCLRDIDECNISLIANYCVHGVCKNTEGHYSCRCKVGFHGSKCDTDTNECTRTTHNICANNGSCINTLGSFYCNCTDGWSPKARCRRDIDECSTNNPCMHGICENTQGSYNCICPHGWQGQNCELTSLDISSYPPSSSTSGGVNESSVTNLDGYEPSFKPQTTSQTFPDQTETGSTMTPLPKLNPNQVDITISPSRRGGNVISNKHLIHPSTTVSGTDAHETTMLGITVETQSSSQTFPAANTGESDKSSSPVITPEITVEQQTNSQTVPTSSIMTSDLRSSPIINPDITVEPQTSLQTVPTTSITESDLRPSPNITPDITVEPQTSMQTFPTTSITESDLRSSPIVNSGITVEPQTSSQTVPTTSITESGLRSSPIITPDITVEPQTSMQTVPSTSITESDLKSSPIINPGITVEPQTNSQTVPTPSITESGLRSSPIIIPDITVEPHTSSQLFPALSTTKYDKGYPRFTNPDVSMEHQINLPTFPTSTTERDPGSPRVTYPDISVVPHASAQTLPVISTTERDLSPTPMKYPDITVEHQTSSKTFPVISTTERDMSPAHDKYPDITVEQQTSSNTYLVISTTERDLNPTHVKYPDITVEQQTSSKTFPAISTTEREPGSPRFTNPDMTMAQQMSSQKFTAIIRTKSDPGSTPVTHPDITFQKQTRLQTTPAISATERNWASPRFTIPDMTVEQQTNSETFPATSTTERSLPVTNPDITFGPPTSAQTFPASSTTEHDSGSIAVKNSPMTTDMQRASFQTNKASQKTTMFSVNHDSSKDFFTSTTPTTSTKERSVSEKRFSTSLYIKTVRTPVNSSSSTEISQTSNPTTQVTQLVQSEPYTIDFKDNVEETNLDKIRTAIIHVLNKTCSDMAGLHIQMRKPVAEIHSVEFSADCNGSRIPNADITEAFSDLSAEQLKSLFPQQLKDKPEVEEATAHASAVVIIVAASASVIIFMLALIGFGCFRRRRALRETRRETSDSVNNTGDLAVGLQEVAAMDNPLFDPTAKDTGDDEALEGTDIRL